MALQKIDWDRFMNQARVKLPGSSESGLKGELYDVFQEFFRDSSSWLEQIVFNTVAGQLDYVVTPTQGGIIIGLSGIVDANNYGVPALMPTLGTISLRDTPNNVQTFTSTIIESVALPTATHMVPIVPAWTLQQYSGVILDGLCGRMMLQKNKPYSDQTLAGYHYRRFRNGIAEARMQALRRYTMGSQSWTYPQQFRTSGQRGGVSVGDNLRF